ncbi:oligosaccharyl transferase, archaeosortase A system-associated [Halovenus sp. WSH3]|uniref:dolichyl-phosphooligosaccharide-protein glycotransferase n=1 Tax=Halovenus carboxidivorans TaxID=2692199 RepID=A0A6B0T619_9EURY|nr:oligosaccharyl transferase, archaeosortase A system-associated [Halovenus carboxidivorans]MXR52367.1 oligosaccharyl transferase, archaeosortase A system-associated [Halovenus carboxidivorans]
MSNWREQLADESETKAVIDWLTEFYHYPLLVFLVGFVFWNRIRNWRNFIYEGQVYYSGNDPWYNHRSAEYATENFLGTMPFDPWTYFPYGTSTGQFGALFDQIIALLALILGLGSPSSSLFDHVVLLAPPLFAVAICIPAYLIGRRLGGRFGGLVVVGFIAFAPDRFLQMTLAGHTQHHAAEALFMTLSILGVMVSLSVAEEERPVYELIAAGEISALRRTIGWSILTGIAMGMYLWAWPPGAWLFGILAVFFIFHLSFEHLRGRSPEHTAFVGVISLTTAGVLQLSTIRTFDMGVASRSFVQPGLAFVVALGLVFMAWLSREVDSRDLSRSAYPGIVGGLLVVGVVFVALALPSLFDFFISQVDRVFGFITSPGTTAGTIGEAQPPENPQQYLYDRYGLGIVTAGVGAAVILGRQALKREPEGQQLLMVFWAAFMIAATMTQTRFGYYLTVPIGALNATVAGFLIQTIGTPDTDEFTIETHQVLTLVLIVMVMFVPLLGLPYTGVDRTATERADNLSQPGNVLVWDQSLQWMEENTPEPGRYNNPDGEAMDYLGTYKRTENYEYPQGAYGVLSWWDYGHWITNRAERIPNANPFQQGVQSAARFLLAQNESEALTTLEKEFDESQGAETRYVMIDWQMAETEGQVGGKYFAPAEFHPDYSTDDFYQRVINPSANPRQLTSAQEIFQQTMLIAHDQRYYNSMLTRLYHYHGSSRAPEAIGVERLPGAGQPAVRSFGSLQEARQWASQSDTRQVGGVGVLPEERVEALKHFRLVHMSETSAVPSQGDENVQELANSGVSFGRLSVIQRDLSNSGITQAYRSMLGPNRTQQAILRSQRALQGSNPAWVKTFERVPGATIQGENGPENGTLRLSVPIKPPNGNEFQYTQRIETDEDGTFNTTVPYSTTGYDEIGVEDGHTNVSARANGSYRITGFSSEEQALYSGQFNVSEEAVVTEDSEPISVELDKRDFGTDENESESGQVQSATVSEPADQITVEFNGETTVADPTAAAARMNATVNGEPVEVTGVSSGEVNTAVTVSLAEPVAAGDSVELSYSTRQNDPAIIIGTRPIESFTTGVENNVGS